MDINDKVNMTDSTTGTSSSTNYNRYTHYYPAAQQGWECPRCGKINAPWVSQCNCSRDNWTVTWASDHVNVKPDWWKDYVYCQQGDSVTTNPNIYQVGGSDYKEGNTYVNVSGTQSNTVDPNSVTYASNQAPNTPTNTVETAEKAIGIKNKYLKK